MSLLVTTSVKAGAEELARARMVAERCGGELVPRTGKLDPLLARGMVYVVGRAKDELRTGGARLAVYEGLLRSRLHTGLEHPLIRAIAPEGRAAHVVDGTLGLAGDALHIAGALDCRVSGVEFSPVMFSLLEEGLARLARNRREVVAHAARRVSPVLGDSMEWLEAQPADSADAVLLAPMYESPDKAAPGFQLLRDVALHGGLQPAQVEAALRVAPRLVVKWPRGEPAPDGFGDREVHHILGHRVLYWVCIR